MKIPSFLLAALLLLTRLTAAPGFTHATSDLPADPAARFGQLPNGVRYVVYPNKEPQGRASLRLLVLAGSLHENENQRGVAHFLEHMAFNGSTHYAPGTLVEFFQRMGMSFGGDTNASTSFDQTIYLLELPHTDPATLGEGLRVFGDYAGGLLLLDKEIDQERGIILSEKRTRDNVGFRTFVEGFNFMLGDTLLPKRIPIGLPEVIEKAPRARFTEFWDTWYRPEKMAVVAVGDFDAAAVEQQIIATFTPLTARAPGPAGARAGRTAESRRRPRALPCRARVARDHREPYRADAVCGRARQRRQPGEAAAPRDRSRDAQPPPQRAGQERRRAFQQRWREYLRRVSFHA